MFAGVSFAALTGFLSLGAVVPALPRVVTGELGGGDLEVGLAVGVFGVGAIVARPVIGRLIDTVGRRPVMLSGLLVAVVAGVLYAFAGSLPLLLAVRVLHGMGEAAVYTAGAAWAVDLAPVERRGQAIGLYGLGVWGGQATGPLIGEAAYRLGGLDAVWAVAAAVPLLGACAVAALHAERPVQVPGMVRELLPAAARLPGLALALASVGVAAITGFGLLLAEHRGMSAGALVWPAFGAGMIAGRLGLGRLPDTVGARRCAIVACLGQAVGLLLVAVAGSLAIALVGAAVSGVSAALIFPSLALLVVDDRTPMAARGAALAAFTASFDLGFAAGGVLLGFTADVAGYGTAFVLAAAACVGASAVAARAAARAMSGPSNAFRMQAE